MLPNVSGNSQPTNHSSPFQTNTLFKFEYITPIQMNREPQSKVQCLWVKSLQELKQITLNTDEHYNLVIHLFWNYISTKLIKYKFSNYQKLKFLQLISKLIKNLFILENHEKQQNLFIQLSKQFHKLQNVLYSKHNFLYDCIIFMCHTFPRLKFDLSQEETLLVAQKVIELCSKDINAFAFLSLYLLTSILKKIEHEPFKQIQTQYMSILYILEKKYPPSKSQNSTKTGLKQNQQNQQKKQSYQMETFIFENNSITKIKQLKKFIINKAKDAKNDQSLFVQLVGETCYKNGNDFKSGMKIKSLQNQDSILRIIQKMVEKQLEQFTCNKQINKHINLSNNKNSSIQLELSKQFQNINFQKLQNSPLYTVRQLKQKIKQQKYFCQKQIIKILQKKKDIFFNIKDLLRGKCNFYSQIQILVTANDLINHINSKKYKVIDTKNRLTQNTKDFVLIIKLPHSVAELQLTLKHDSVVNQFNHKIYELKRSKLYTPMINLFIHNQKWGNNFFSQQIQLFQEIVKLQNSIQHIETVKFKDFESYIQNFKRMYLQPSQIQYKLNIRQMYQEYKSKIQSQINKLKNTIKQNKKNKVKFKYDQNFIKQIKQLFCKNKADYDNISQQNDKNQNETQQNITVKKHKGFGYYISKFEQFSKCLKARFQTKMVNQQSQ